MEINPEINTSINTDVGGTKIAQKKSSDLSREYPQEKKQKRTSDYRLDKIGRKVKAHTLKFAQGEDDGKKSFNGVNEHMKKTFNNFVEQHTAELTEEQLNELVAELQEVLGKSAEAGDWISDFVKSDNPKFAGKSKEKRKQMALAAYYAAQRNEEVEIVEELTESYHPDDYEASSEKSQFGGHRAIVKHKATGREIYSGGTAYKSAEHAKGEAETYRTNYSTKGKGGPGAVYAHDRAIDKYRKTAKAAGHLREGWADMMADVKKRSESEKKTTTRTAHDVKQTSTGTVYTKQRDADGNSKEFNRSGEAAQKRGRGRPKKNSFGEAVEFLMGLDEETFDSMMEEGFDSFFETYETLDEVSKATLGSYVKKAVSGMNGVAVNAHMAGGEKPGSPQINNFLTKARKRIAGIDKATDRLTK